MPSLPFSSGARLREANRESGAPQPQVVFFLSQSPSRQKIRLWSCWLKQQLTRKHFLCLWPPLRPVEKKHPEHPRASQGNAHCTVASRREPPPYRGEQGTVPALQALSLPSARSWGWKNSPAEGVHPVGVGLLAPRQVARSIPCQKVRVQSTAMLGLSQPGQSALC